MHECIRINRQFLIAGLLLSQYYDCSLLLRSDSLIEFISEGMSSNARTFFMFQSGIVFNHGSVGSSPEVGG